MSDDKKFNKNISIEDAGLWRSLTEDVDRLPGKDYVEGEEIAQNEPSDFTIGETIIPERVTPPVKSPQGNELDGRTQDRLRKGQIAIEATFDLHGMRQSEAEQALYTFITRCYEQGKRCVLVITGKGKSQASSEDWLAPEPGILKIRTPEWLRQPPIKDFVLQYQTAKQKHGGEGALYVYLRRNRER